MSPSELTAEAAFTLASDAARSGDMKPLQPHIDAMMTEGYKMAQTASAISGDPISPLNLFIAMCEDRALLTDDQTMDLIDLTVESRRARRGD
jgi:hypothetical protein